MNVFIKLPSPNKAKMDIDQLMEADGFINIAVGVKGTGGVARFMRKLLSVLNILFKVHRGDVVLIQYPFKKFYVMQCELARLKGAKTITLIHDLGTFRRRKLTATQEMKRLSHTDHLIVHNESMKRWLEEHGWNKGITCLEIFDYLVGEQGPQGAENREHSKPRIVYAGGFGEKKSSFVYKIDKVMAGLEFQLYGKGETAGYAEYWDNVKYMGCLSSDELIRTVDADWGLVWDGDAVETLSGNWGEYLKLNNPHKTSFYLCAGLPVVMWTGSAMAPFILEHKLGITVDSLEELPLKLIMMPKEEYKELKDSAVEFSEKLKSGYFFRKAFGAALQYLGVRSDGEHLSLQLPLEHR